MSIDWPVAECRLPASNGHKAAKRRQEATPRKVIAESRWVAAGQQPVRRGALRSIAPRLLSIGVIGNAAAICYHSRNRRQTLPEGHRPVQVCRCTGTYKQYDNALARASLLLK